MLRTEKISYGEEALGKASLREHNLMAWYQFSQFVPYPAILDKKRELGGFRWQLPSSFSNLGLFTFYRNIAAAVSCIG
jgi:hypothetical protein